MRFQRIIEALYRQPLDITPGGFDAIDAIVRPYLTRRAGTDAPYQIKDGAFVLGKTDLWGTPLPEMLSIDEETGFAIIAVTGPLLQHAGLIDKSCGACSYQDISLALDEAVQDSRVRNVILNFDSPGGQHCGVIELAEKILAVSEMGEKGIYAFTETTMASAAYCLAASCNGIFVTKTPHVGCIGSLIAFVDFSAAYEQAGKKAVVLASGKYKGTGVEGTSLSADQTEYLMGLVMGSAQQFKNHVLHSRHVEASAMEGQCFYGEEAIKQNLADELVAGIWEIPEMVG